MAELIDKKSALNALNDVSYGNFNYVTARNAIDCIRTTTEAEIRAKAIEEFLQFVQENSFNEEYDNEDGWALSDLIILATEYQKGE